MALRLIFPILIACVIFELAGCRSKVAMVSPVSVDQQIIDIKGEIVSNTVWTSKNRYILHDFVYVTTGVTLTIEPGTVILGGSSTDGNNKPAALIIEPGAKIEAVGTAESPIIFTSGKISGSRGYGDWAGLVLLGRAPHNQPAETLNPHGIRGTMNAGNKADDNSGTLRYIRIEYAGAAVCCSDFSGLSLFGVGSGTEIDHVQVSYSGGDSYDWRGGTVNARYLISLRPFDDDFDTDFGYRGHVQFAVSLRDPEVADASGSNCIESDNYNPGENSDSSPLQLNRGLPLTRPIFANISGFAFFDTPVTTTVKGSGPYQTAVHIRRNAATSVINSLFVGWPEGVRLDGSLSGTWQNVLLGDLALEGVTLANVGGAIPLLGSGFTLEVRGAGQITNQQAKDYFLTPARGNKIVTRPDLPMLLLNQNNFNLDRPEFLPQSSSPLLTGGQNNSKLIDPFFIPTNYCGAFGGADWTKGWSEWSPQKADYGL